MSIKPSDPFSPLDQLLTRAVPPRYDSLAEAESEIDALTDGQIVYITADNAVYLRSGGAWRALVRPWQSYSASLSGAPTSSVVARWTQVLNTVHFRFEATLSGAATGQLQFPLPVPRADTTRRQSVGDAVLWDQSASAGRAWHALIGAGQATGVNLIGPNYEIVAATTPWSWASGDQVSVAGTYEAA